VFEIFNEEKLIVQVAYYYYKEGLTQSEIAERLLITRQRVNKLIKQSRDTGVVEITINGMDNFLIDIETKLEKKYKLSKCMVIPTPNNDDELFEKLGAEGASYLEKSLSSGMTIGTSWGMTIYHLVTKMPNITTKLKDLKVVQLVGSSNKYNSEVRSVSITRLLSEKIGAHALFLYAPAFVNEASREIFMAEESIKSVFDEMKKCDIIVTSVGDLSQQASSLNEHTIDPEFHKDLLKSTAVGNLFLEYLDINGKPVDCMLNKKRIGISVSTLKDIPNVIMVAGGKNKVLPIKSALNGEYANTLITDYETALQLIKD